MAFLLHEAVAATSSVKTVSALSVPYNATSALLQAATNNVRYTMDGSTNPTVSSGMLLLTTEDATEFLIEDIKNIRFIRDGGTDGSLNIHYYAGRDV